MPLPYYKELESNLNSIMKTYADESWEREVERFSSFQFLWKTDDENWVEARKKAWRAANEDAGENPWTLVYGKFYIYGDEPPRCFVDDTGREQDIRFDIGRRITYTPFATADDLLQFWEVLLERSPAGISQNHGAFRHVGGNLEEFPEHDNLVKLVTETMYSPEFFMLGAEGKVNTTRNLITINPRDFVIDFTGLSSFYDKNNCHEWDYRNFSIEYFLMSVQYCEENDALVTPRQQKDIPNMYEFLLALDDSKLDRYRLELKQTLVSAAEAENAPALLSEALESAQNSEKLWALHEGYTQYFQPSRVKPRHKLKKPNLP